MIRCAVVLSLLLAASLAEAHDAQFWKDLAAHDTSTAAEAPALAREALALLSSPNPALRDEAAYALYVSWIYERHVLPPTELVALTDVLVPKLRDGIDHPGDDRVLARSFSALVLSILVARDDDAPAYSKEELRKVWNAALTYLKLEHDLRGYDEKLGWIHATAHAADLLKFLLRSSQMSASSFAEAEDAIVAKLDDADVVFTFGEDERLARAAFAIVTRPTFDDAPFCAWVKRLVPSAGVASVDKLRRDQNRKNFMAKLAVLVNGLDHPTTAQMRVRDTLRAALKDLF